MSSFTNHKKLYLSLIVIIALILIIAVTRKEDPIPVQLHTIAKGVVEYTVANTRAGTVKACRRAKLAPTIGGQVAELAVKEGDKVAANQLLLEIWNEDLAAQVSLAKSEANAARQNAEEVCLRAEAAKRDAQRIIALWEEKLASEEAADRAQTNLKTTQAACEAAQSRVQVSQAQLKVAQASLERTRLRAPFAGFIAEINGEIGEYVTPSPPGIPTPPAIDIVDTSCLYILAPIDEVDAPAIQEGMETRITLDAFPNQHFLGAVRRIAPYVFEVEKQARTVDIEAVFLNEEEYAVLKPGYSADLEVIIDAKYDVIRAPTEAIVEGNKAYVYDPEEQQIHLKTVETGIANWNYTEIEKGLQVGDQIVTSIDREGVKDGAYVEPENNKR